MVYGVLSLYHVVLYVAAYPVLRPEKGCEFYLRMIIEKVSNVLEIVIHGSLIANHSDSGPAQKFKTLFQQFLNAKDRPSTRLRSTRRLYFAHSRIITFVPNHSLPHVNIKIVNASLHSDEVCH